MHLGFSKHSLATKSVEELGVIKNRCEVIAIVLLIAHFAYPFSYAWEVGNYVISHRLGVYAIILGFIWFSVNTMYMFNQIEAVKNKLDPERLKRKMEEDEPPTKLTKMLNKVLYLSGGIVVVGLVWLGVSIYKDVGANPISEEARYTKVFAKLESKKCTLSGYQKKYDGMARPIFVEKNKTQGSVINHITNDVSKRTTFSSNFDKSYAVYQCADGSVEKSQYIFRVLMK